MDHGQAKKALSNIQDAEEARQSELDNFSADKYEESEEDCNSEHLIFDIFYEVEGEKGVISITNFSRQELQTLYDRSENFIKISWKRVRGNKSSISCFGIFFIALTVCEMGGTWDNLARLFRMKTPAFQRAVNKFVRMFETDFYVDYVMKIEEKFGMAYVVKKNKIFKNFPPARNATNVLFLHGNRPLCSMEDEKKYYCGKHKLYGQKVEVSIPSCGLALNCVDPKPGSVADSSIFQENLDFHKKSLLESSEEHDVEDVDEDDENTYDSWAVIMDKGYTGMGKIARCIIPKKRPQNGFLSYAESRRNKSISSERIIIENYFGRMQSFWNVIGSKWRWEGSSLRIYFRFAMAITNYHVIKNSPWLEDGEFSQKSKNRLYEIGLSAEKKRMKGRKDYYQREKMKVFSDTTNQQGSKHVFDSNDDGNDEVYHNAAVVSTDYGSDENKCRVGGADKVCLSAILLSYCAISEFSTVLSFLYGGPHVFELN